MRIFDLTINTQCSSPIFKWDKPYCPHIKCIDLGGKKVRIQIPDECEDECLYVDVTCNDKTCNDCPDSERLKICLCDGPEDCDGCSECIDNLCVSTCKGNEFCEDEKCVMCSNEVPCPNNQICIDGDCKCPPDKPFKNNKGVCVSCLDEGDCPPCTVCTPNGCMPLDCVEGVCDPNTGDCVECINSGDCDGDNECCSGKKCDCCPGFVRNFATGECEPAPDCTLDTDCPECYNCNLGICEPVKCPEGYICVKGECEPICDCSQSLCSETEACVSLDSGDCYCNKCEGDCTTGADCGPGCYCKDGKCKPKPCKGDCTTGADCGPGCGCFEGECVPCDSFDCTSGTDCSDVLGCACTSQGCQDIKSCSGDCSTQGDCGPGCTCFEGECVSCADFSCEDCYKHPGCACKDGKCQDDNKGCQDEFKLTVLDDTCDLKAELTTYEGCACSKITANTVMSKLTASNSGYLMDISVELRKGAGVSLAQAKTLPKLKDSSHKEIAENEAPTSGTFSVNVQPFYDEFNVNGKKINTNVAGVIVTKSASIANTDTAVIKDVFVKTPGTKEGQFLVVTRVEVKVNQSTNLVFPNNCKYDAIKLIDTFTVGLNNVSQLNAILTGNQTYKSLFEGYTVITSDDLRNPLFTWYISQDGIYSDSEAVRKIYIEKINGKYTDVLYGPVDAPKGKYPLTPEEGSLRSNKYYFVTNDCGCTKNGDFGKIVFCNPDELFYTSLNCNTKIRLEEPFAPCSVNKLLTKYGVNDPQSQVEYKLFLNNTLVSTFVDSIYGMVQKGTTNSMFTEYHLNGETITKIELKINHDDQNRCSLLYLLEDPSDKEITFTTNCEAAGSFYKLFLPKVGLNYVVTSVTANAGATVTEKSTQFELNVKKGIDTTISVTFDDGCKKDLFVNEDCCESFDAIFERTSTNRDTFLNLKLDIVSGTYPFTIRYTGPELDETYVYNNVASLGEEDQTPSGPGVTKADNKGLVMTSYLPGLYKVKITDKLGCEIEKTLNIDYIDDPLLVFDGYDDFCDGDSTQINITGDATTVGGNLYYKENNVSKSLTLNSLGKANITNIQSSKTFVFEKLNVEGYEYNVNKVIEIVEKQYPVAVLSTTNNALCLGDETTITVTGTVGSIANVSNYGPVTIEEGGTTITVAPESTTTYSITSVENNGCQSGSGNSITITVYPPVTLTLVSSVCNNDLTLRTLTFSNISSATDQNGIPLTVVSNSVTIDPEIVNIVNVTYNSGSCTKIQSFTVLPCECPNINYTIVNQGEICENTVTFNTPVVVNLGSGVYDILVKDQDNNTVSSLTSVSATFTVSSLPILANEDTKLTIKITNHDISTCFIDNILVEPVVRILPELPTMDPFYIYGDLCLNQEINFEPKMGTGGYTFEWTVTRVSNMADVTPVDNEFPSLSFTATVEDSYEVSLTYSRYGCSKTATKIVTIAPCCDLMVVDIQGNEDLCENLTAVPSGGQAPYTYQWTGPSISATTAEVDLSGVGSGVTISLTYLVTDANGCEVTDTISYTGCTCTPALNLLPSYVDGTFESLSGVASTGTQGQNSNVVASGWINSSGSPDSWKPPIGINSPSQIAKQLVASPAGGVFVGGFALASGSPEGIQTTLSTIVGQTYVIKFYQANAGYSGATVGDEGKWLVVFGNQSTHSDPEAFAGYGSQTWTEQSVSFVANATSTLLKFIAAKEVPATGVYMAIDEIRVYHDNGNNPCV